MSNLSRRVLPLWTAATLSLTGLSACATAPATTPVVATTASVTIRNPWPAARRVQALAAPAFLRIRITGPTGAPFERVVPADTPELTFSAVPMGDWRILTIEGLDADQAPVPGAVARAAAHLQPGPNAIAIDPVTTAVGAVAEGLLARDREQGTRKIAGFTPAGLEAALRRYLQAAGAASPVLLDTSAIAEAAHTAGAMPETLETAVHAPGRVVVKRENWPAGLAMQAVISDPLSGPATLNPDEDLVFEHVAPGSWTLQVSRAEATLAPIAVAVTAGTTTTVTASYGAAPRSLPSLPDWIAGGVFGVLGDGADATFYMWGGSTWGGGFHERNFAFQPGGTAWTSTAFTYDSPQEAASVVHEGAIYSFGGLENDGGTYRSGAVYRYTPGLADTEYFSDLPEAMGVSGATAGAIGDTVYLGGGVWDDDEGASYTRERLLAYRPADDHWEAIPVPAPEADQTWLASAYMTSATVGDRWYLFGGQTAPDAAPLGQVSVFDPADRTWRRLAPMPTPRSGAAAVVVDGKIWVIGGLIAGFEASDAVEVFDPATGRWEARPRLRSGRYMPAVGLVGGKIVVAGGLDGHDQYRMAPKRSVEEITP